MNDRTDRLTTAALWVAGLAGTCHVLASRLAGARWPAGAGRAAWAAAALGAVVGLGVVATKAGRSLLSEPGTGTAWKLLASAAQLGSLVLLFRAYRLEHDAFRGVVVSVVFFGFLVHHGLADRLRLPFFVGLSMATFTAVLGPRGGLFLVGIGLLLVGICHLPASFRVRTALLAGTGLGLALLRAGAAPSPVPAAVWPLAGSFFMFRTACYLYDLRHAKAPVGLWPTLAYFFLLPNIAFLLFPVVDFATLRRTRLAGDPFEIYQRGLRLLLRGAVYLLLYRAVYRYLVFSPAEVTGAGDLARYLVANFLLLLQVLGQLDLAVGILLVFGFDLPEINELNLFAPGFAHFWRRTNKYWRDFITKVVYYPVYFRLRGLAATPRVLVALAIAFLVSALLHAYQWFWLRGEVPVSATDGAFWLVFGSLLLVNVYLETLQSQRTNVGKRSPPELALHVLKCAAMFVTVSVLWALWTATSLREWVSLLRYAASPSRQGPGWIAGAAAVLLVYGLAYAFLHPARPGSGGRPAPFTRRWVAASALTVLLYAAALPAVTPRLGAGPANVVRNLRSLRLNRFDDQELVRGYYENLTRVSSASPALWRVFQGQRSTASKQWVEEMGRPTRDLRAVELLPDVRIERTSGPVTTNRFGMRDRDYEPRKPPGTYRAALVGGSYLVGRDVPDGATFEALVEDRLNRQAQPPARYELLSFGVGGYGPLESLLTLEQKVLAFEPDAVWYVAVEGELRRPADCLVRGVRAKVDLAYPEIRTIASEAGLGPAFTEEESKRRLRPRWEELLTFCYRRMVTSCRDRGIVPVWIYLPPVDMEPAPEEVATSKRLAAEAGFVVIDLSDVYGKTEHGKIRVTPDNHHPNRLGHELIADGLHAAISAHAAELRLTPTPGTTERTP